MTMSAQAMYATSVAMTAAALGIPITADTGTSVMRLREGPDGPAEGFIVDRDGVPTLVVALDLYMDAPDMAVPLATHGNVIGVLDLQSSVVHPLSNLPRHQSG